MARRRLDLTLVERGLAPSREIAQSLIMRGDVLVDDRVVDKPGVPVRDEAAVRLRGELPRFVSRGGDKIDPAFEKFEIQLAGRIAVDVGASTGGFTDAMLQRGASRVYAVDVGHNQLAEKLRRDERVVVFERFNARDFTPGQLTPAPNFCVIDVSFIGVRKLLDPILGVLERPCELLILVKPQFELGPEFVEKGGVVRDESSQLLAVDLVSRAVTERCGVVVGFMPSPIRGAKKGNQEYLLCARFSG